MQFAKDHLKYLHSRHVLWMQMPTKQGKPVVMVVEDDAELRDSVLVPGLAAEGFHAMAADSAMAMYRALTLRTFDAVIVDIGLPDESGFEIVRHLHQLGGVGVVVLTGRVETEDRVRGLDGGADAYLVKPVGVDVIAATLRSVLRRMGGEAVIRSAVASTSGWRLEQQGWQIVSPQASVVALSGSERALLTCLAKSAGEVVARSVILQSLCGDDPEFDPHRLEMLVHRLRRKVQAATGDELPLVTVRGQGYLLLE